MRLSSSLAALALAGCTYISDKEYSERLDLDGDGMLVPDDCNDNDPNVSDLVQYYVDSDGDGVGSPDGGRLSCGPDSGMVAVGSDLCDDNPDLLAPKTWFQDADGDGLGSEAVSEDACAPPGEDWVEVGTDRCDNDATLVLPKTWFKDEDGDGLGNQEVSQDACSPPGESWVEVGTDQCDNDPTLVRPKTWYEDDDGDGLGNANLPSEACAPSGPQWVDNALDECNGSPLTSPREFWIDGDQDGVGIPATPAFLFCGEEPPDGYIFVGVQEDCDDTDNRTYPGADELCDPIDHNCNGDPDDGVGLDAPEYYLDADFDGYPSDTIVSDCGAPEPQYIPTNVYPTLGDLLAVLDCDDDNPAVNPSMPEIYDGADDVVIDNDCDPSNDRDHDGDGDEASYYGGTDCDDADPARAGIFAEIYYDSLAIDNDCDPTTDSFDRDADGALDPQVDGSAHPDANDGAPRDCNDTDPSVSPFAEERAGDTIDGNCDGQFTGVLCGLDLDGDGYGSNDPADLVVWDGNDPAICDGVSEGGLPVGPPGDCDDNSNQVNPDQTEVYEAELIDNDCDPSNDRDIDGDGDDFVEYGGTDCDDADPSRAGALPEVYYDLEAVDNDCDDTTDSFDQDGDGSFHPSVDGSNHPASGDGAPRDCDDDNALRSPLLLETANDGIDNNCDGTFTGILCGIDLDGDGQGSTQPGEMVAFDGNAPSDCNGLSEVGLPVAPPGDCNDADPDTYTGAQEMCDGRDNNCDGDADSKLILAREVFSGQTQSLPEGDHAFLAAQDIEVCSFTFADVNATFSFVGTSSLTMVYGTTLVGTGSNTVITSEPGSEVTLHDVTISNGDLQVYGTVIANGGTWSEVDVTVHPNASLVSDEVSFYETHFDVDGGLDLSHGFVNNTTKPFISVTDGFLFLRDLYVIAEGHAFVEALDSSITAVLVDQYANVNASYEVTDSQLTIVDSWAEQGTGRWIDATRGNVFVGGGGVIGYSATQSIINGNAANVTISGMEGFYGNTGDGAPLIQVNEADLVLDSVYSPRTDVDQPDTLASANYGTLTLRDSFIARRASEQSHALLQAGYADVWVEGSSFESDEGAAPSVLWASSSSVVFTDNLVEGTGTNPFPETYPPVIEMQGGSASISYSTLIDNNCSGCGYGVNLVEGYSTNIVLRESTLETTGTAITMQGGSVNSTNGTSTNCSDDPVVRLESSYGVSLNASTVVSLRVCTTVGTDVGGAYVPASANQTQVTCNAGTCTATLL